MRTARIRATGEAMSKDSVPENHGAAKIRRRARTSGTTAPDAPGVSGTDARDGARAIPSAEPMEKIMNQHVASRTFERNVPDDLGLDMSQLTINELVTVFEGLRTLSHVTCGILGEPRCRNGVETLFDGLWSRLNGEWGKAIREIDARIPNNRAEKEARDYAIVANSIDQGSPIDECLADAQARIERKPLSEKVADQRWEQAEREAVQSAPVHPDAELIRLGEELAHAMKLCAEAAAEAHRTRDLFERNCKTAGISWGDAETRSVLGHPESVVAHDHWSACEVRVRAIVEKIDALSARTTAGLAVRGDALLWSLYLWERGCAEEDYSEDAQALRAFIAELRGLDPLATGGLVDQAAAGDFPPAAAEKAADREWESTAQKADEAQGTYNLDNLDSDIVHLHELLDTIVDQLMDMDFGTGPARNHQLDRVSALTWVARDISGNLVKRLDEDYRLIGCTFSARPHENAA